MEIDVAQNVDIKVRLVEGEREARSILLQVAIHEPEAEHLGDEEQAETPEGRSDDLHIDGEEEEHERLRNACARHQEGDGDACAAMPANRRRLRMDEDEVVLVDKVLEGEEQQAERQDQRCHDRERQYQRQESEHVRPLVKVRKGLDLLGELELASRQCRALLPSLRQLTRNAQQIGHVTEQRRLHHELDGHHAVREQAARVPQLPQTAETSFDHNLHENQRQRWDDENRHQQMPEHSPHGSSLDHDLGMKAFVLYQIYIHTHVHPRAVR